MEYVGPEGDEARALVREMRSFNAYGGTTAAILSNQYLPSSKSLLGADISASRGAAAAAGAATATSGDRNDADYDAHDAHDDALRCQSTTPSSAARFRGGQLSHSMTGRGNGSRLFASEDRHAVLSSPRSYEVEGMNQSFMDVNSNNSANSSLLDSFDRRRRSSGGSSLDGYDARVMGELSMSMEEQDE